MSSYFLGDSVKQFSLTIGIYMFAMGVGSFLTKFVKERELEAFIRTELLLGLLGGLGFYLPPHLQQQPLEPHLLISPDRPRILTVYLQSHLR